jgi:putative transposase
MQRHAHEFSIAAMSRVLLVTRQGYHAWKPRRPSARACANEVLRVDSRAIHAQSRRSYGSRRVRRQLRRQGHCVGRHRVARIMEQEGLRAKRSRRFRVTTDSRSTKVIHENVLARDFAVGTPNRARAGDITYLWTQEGWLYLAVILDVGTRRVIGWSFRETLVTGLSGIDRHDSFVGRGREILVHPSALSRAFPGHFGGKSRRNSYPPPGRKGVSWNSMSYLISLQRRGQSSRMTSFGNPSDFP